MSVCDKSFDTGILRDIYWQIHGEYPKSTRDNVNRKPARE